jgi:hypothetical protein
MNQDEYKELKESGGLVDDAGQQEEVIEQEEETGIEKDELEKELEASEETDDDDLPELPEKERTAFERRMEREKAKLQEKIEAEMQKKYGKHQQIVDLLGGDADAVEKRIRDQQLVSQAQHIADQNGWDEEQTQWYINQQKQDQELKELRVQMQINKLRDNPDYAGIASLEREIMSKIDKTNGALTVEEAYWALGGKNKADQIRLEAQVRESEKRKKQPRTVLTDSAAGTVTEKPLPADVMRDAERMGISAAEARRLMSKEPAKDIAEWRKNKQAK